MKSGNVLTAVFITVTLSLGLAGCASTSPDRQISCDSSELRDGVCPKGKAKQARPFSAPGGGDRN